VIRRSTRRGLSTGTQLALLMVAVVTAGFLTAGWIALRISTEEQTRQIDRTLAESVAGARDLLDTLDAAQIEALSQLPSSVALWRADTEGRPLAGGVVSQLDLQASTGIVDLSALPSTRLLAEVGRPFTIDQEGGPVRVLVARDGSEFLAAASSLDRVRASEDRLSTQLALVGLGVVAVVALLIGGGIGTILQPLRATVTNARKIGEGDTSVTLDLRHGPSEVRELGAALDGMRVRMADDTERVRRFAADASHDLRTPLAVISGHVQLHRRGITAPDAWDEIATQTERMQRLVDDLLLLSVLDTVHTQDDLADARGLVDLAELAHDAVATQSTVDPDRTYRADTPGEPVLVDADEQQVRRAVDNLVRNVAGHTGPGTSAVVSVRREGGSCLIRVADDGPGLLAAERTHALRRFWRADRSRHAAGSGLGLAIAAGIASSHGGGIVLDAVSPHGLAVTLRFPGAAVRDDDGVS
jgi:two-component system, OmpR family, sensor kinase